MSTSPARYGGRTPGEPVVHDLPPLRYGADLIPVRIVVRRTEDGEWRARLVFGEGEPGEAPTTAEIFYAPHESELWQSVRDLRDGHLTDLYRSLCE